MYFNLLSTVIILVILYLYNILTSKLRLCRPEVTVSGSHSMAGYRQLGWGRVQVVIMVYVKDIVCKLKKAKTRYSCYKCLNISSVRLRTFPMVVKSSYPGWTIRCSIWTINTLAHPLISTYFFYIIVPDLVVLIQLKYYLLDIKQ